MRACSAATRSHDEYLCSPPLIAFILANSHGDFLRGKIRGGGTKQPAPPYQRPAASTPQMGGGHHCCCCLNPPPNPLFPWPSTPQGLQGALRSTTGTGELEHSGISALTTLQGQDTRSNARCGHFGPALCRLQLLQQPLVSLSGWTRRGFPPAFLDEMKGRKIKGGSSQNEL